MIPKNKQLLNNDYILSLFNKIYSILIGIVSSAFYIRYLGIQYKGTYSYINEITTIIGLVINMGIYQSYPFFFREKGHGIFTDYVNTFVQQFLIYFGISAGIVVFSFNRDYIVLFVAIQVPFLVFKTQLDNIILVEQLKLYMWVDMGLKTILALIYFLLWLFAPVHISYVVFTVSITNLFVCIIYLYSTKYKFSLACLKPNVAFIKEVVRFGFFPMLSALLITLNYSVDIIFLQNMGSAVELSIYSVAAVLINYVWIIPNAFKDVLISKVARTSSQNEVDFSCRISLFITLVCLIGFFIIGRPVITIIFGADFEKCYSVTLILFIGAFSMIFFKMLGVVFVTEGKQLEYFMILLISVIVNVIANYLFIPIWGMYGAAFASVTSYTLCGIAFLLKYCKWKKEKVSNYIKPQKKDIVPVIKILYLRRNR